MNLFDMFIYPVAHSCLTIEDLAFPVKTWMSSLTVILTVYTAAIYSVRLFLSALLLFHQNHITTAWLMVILCAQEHLFQWPCQSRCFINPLLCQVAETGCLLATWGNSYTFYALYCTSNLYASVLNTFLSNPFWITWIKSCPSEGSAD